MSPMGVIVALVGAAIATVVSRATGAGWPATVGLALLLGAGLYLWARDPDKGWGDLGEGIMVSVIVAIALMAVQRDADERTRNADQRRNDQLRDADVRRERQIREVEAARQKAAERENLQLSLTMQTDLRGIALAGRDMNGFFLANKNFAGADLHGAKLAGADLRRSRFRRTDLLGARLDEARMEETYLRGALLSSHRLLLMERTPSSTKPASLREADLRGADLRRTNLWGVDFTGAKLVRADLGDTSPDIVVGGKGPTFREAILNEADFRGADLSRADLRGARLGGARLCDVMGLRSAKLDGAIYDASTRWPPGFDPKARGAVRKPSQEARRFSGSGLLDIVATGGYPLCERY